MKTNFPEIVKIHIKGINSNNSDCPGYDYVLKLKMTMTMTSNSSSRLTFRFNISQAFTITLEFKH